MIGLLGIDCATVPSKTGLALGELRGGVVHILRCGVGSRSATPAAIAAEWLRDYEEALIAFDAPLGWPRALGVSLHNHRAGMPLEAEANRLFRRTADVEIKQRLGKLPLEVGANFIARTAAAALVLLDQIRQDSGRPIPLAWAPREQEPWRAIEAYPAATRIGHGVPDAGGSLGGLDAVLDWSAVSSASLESEHGRDAAVCALAGADFLLGRAISPVDRETAVIEGWIWAPAAPRSNRQNGMRSDRAVRAVSTGSRESESGVTQPHGAQASPAGNCLACRRGLPSSTPRRCPECGFMFAGKSWEGIDAHWKARHAEVMAYADFWDSLCTAHRGS